LIIPHVAQHLPNLIFETLLFLPKGNTEMSKPVSAKMGIKENVRAIFVDAPADAIKSIDPPTLNVASRLQGTFDYIHLFSGKQKALQKKFPKLKAHLKGQGALWVSWPKAKQQETDLTLTTVIKIGYDYGLVESKTLSIDKIWSAIKFTHPKKGKVYNNSYGTLKK
jgi:hypothetical protein